MSYALGIDLGTTYTAAAVWRDGRAETAPLADRAHSIPSALYLRDDGVMLVGDAANRRGTTDPDRVAREFKRRLGDDSAPLLLGDTVVSAAELTGYLLRWVVDRVSEREGARPDHVTLTCPATWGDYRRQLMTSAAATAQLTDVGLLPEPVAAAVYYASLERLAPGALVGVYDLGGGTFDATVVRKTDTGFDIHGAAGGDDSIGGTDFDQVVMDHVANTLDVAWYAFDTEDPTVLAGLAQVRAHAVAAKEALSTDVDATIPVILPDLTRDVRITRGEFEAAIRIPVLRTVDTLAQTVAAAGVDVADLHAVLLVGGSSRIPLVSRLIAQELGVPVAVDTHPKYAVCLGAAISAGSRVLSAPSLSSAPPTFRPPLSASPLSAPVSPPPTLDSPASGAPLAGTSSFVAQWSGTPASGTPHSGRPWSGTPASGTPDSGPLVAAPAADLDGLDLLADAPESPVIAVNLADAGLTRPLDVLLSPVPDPGRPLPPLTGRDEPLTIAHTGDSRRGRRIAAAVTVGAVVVVAAASVLAAVARSHPPAAGPTPSGRASTSAGGSPAPGAPAATLAAVPLPQRPGDVIHAVTGAPGGGLVAVGASTTDGVPRAWRYRDGGWSELPGPGAQTAQRGEMNGVAATKAGLVAVGWTAPRDQPAAAANRKPAVWTSTDGGGWTLRPAPGGGSTKFGELTDVTALTDGTLFAAGTDWAADATDGDGALLSSVDGRDWNRVAARGLDGPGPSVLRRLLTGPGGDLLAVGTRLDGSASRSVLWTAPDRQTWSATTLPSTGSALGSAWGLARLGDGTLVVGGFRAAADGTRTALLWSGPGVDDLRPVPVSGASGTVYAMTVVDGALTALGGTDTGAAAWTVSLPR